MTTTILMPSAEARRLLAIRAEAERQFAAEMQGRIAMTPKAVKLRNKMDEIDTALRAAERIATQRLAFEKMPFEKMMEVLAIPLLADVINDVITGVDTTFREAGISTTIYGEVAREIRRKALWMVDTLAKTGADIPDLITDDEMIVETIKRKLYKYIEYRVKPQYRKR